MLVPVETEVLVVGTGPAGASLACFLASYGVKGIMIGAASSTADGPRAHITNMAALDCLRDIGLDDECTKLGSQGDTMMHTRWAHSMAGVEYARLYSWGNNPKRMGEYKAASPSTHIDLPQTLLEPVLVRYATVNGFTCRMNTKFLSFTQNGDSTVTTAVVDSITSNKYTIRSKYLFGADGARSEIVRQLDLPLLGATGANLAIDVLVKADLSHLIQHKTGNLHWLIQPELEHPPYAWLGVARMVKPWDEWIFSFFPSLDAPKPLAVPSAEECLARVKQFIGDNTPVSVTRISKWYINEIVAAEYSKGSVICLGDAVHRHPPMNGLGSNTCIQDAFNLAWKVAYVLNGHASGSLLSTYTAERQPVGASIIKRANDSFRAHVNLWSALGIVKTSAAGVPSMTSVDERKVALEEMGENSTAGRTRREHFRDAVQDSAHEFHALGIEMGQLYQSSAIYVLGEQGDFVPGESEMKDPVLHYEPSTYPGRRLPHAWLNSFCPGKMISTIDLAGKGAFAIFIGIGGHKWKEAAKRVEEEIGLGKVGMKVISVGWGCDWRDVYGEWERLKGVEEKGCIVVRPDLFVCARKLNEGDEFEWLSEVMKKILGLEK